MKKSIALLSALVVSTTFIVNCQKAPDKRRVRPSAGSGSGSQSDVVDEKAKLPTKICTKETLDLYKAYYKNKQSVSATVITAASTESEKESYRKLGVETLAKCDELITSLKTETNEGCLMDNGVKSAQNSLMASAMQNECNSLGKKLKTDVELDSTYADAAKAKEQAQADKKKIKDELINKSLKMSKEARALVLEGSTNGGKFLVEGVVQSTTSSMEQALAASQTVCTFLGAGLEIDETKETTLKITNIRKAVTDDLTALKADFKGKATVLQTEIKQDGEEVPSVMELLCANLDIETITVDGITKALGTGITSAPAQVTTEVTGGTSNAVSATTFTSADLAAAQPAGSPQAQNLASGTAQMVANANLIVGQKVADQQAAASKTAVVSATAAVSAAPQAKVDDEQDQEEVAAPTTSGTAVVASGAAVVSTNNSGGASAAVSATAGTKVSAEDLALLKEKADRLEKEAKDAEAEVTKLTDAKAKAEDIDDAKAKARITRESANTAKAEYDAAAAQA